MPGPRPGTALLMTCRAGTERMSFSFAALKMSQQVLSAVFVYLFDPFWLTDEGLESSANGLRWVVQPQLQPGGADHSHSKALGI